MRKSLLISIILAIITGVCSYYKMVFVPYMVIAFVLSVIIMVSINKVSAKDYPIYIYFISLLLIWQSTMLGIHIVGADIHGEMSIVNKTIQDGWKISYYNPNNTSIVVGGLTPLLSKIGFSPIWQFKAFFPMFLAGVPVILYYAYCRFINERKSFFATIFFIIMPVYFLEITGITKSMFAELFLAIMVLIATSNIRNRNKAIFIGLSIASATFIHYTIGMIMIMFVAIALIISIGTMIIRFKNLKFIHIHKRMSSVILAVVILITYLWYANVGGGSLIYAYKLIIKAYGGNAILYMSYLNPFDKKVKEVAPIAQNGRVVQNPYNDDTPKTPKVDNKVDVVESPTNAPTNQSAVPKSVNTESTDFYISKQEPLIKLAVGMDFKSSTLEGKIFRIFQYLTQLFLVIGFFYMLLRYKKYKFSSDYMAYVGASFGLLAMCIFVPWFSSLVNMTRFYHYALFFISPLLIIGIDELVNDLRSIKCLKLQCR